MRIARALLVGLLLVVGTAGAVQAQTVEPHGTSELVRAVSLSAVGVTSGPMRPDAEGVSFGSGFIVDAENGTVLTAAHLIRDARNVSVLDNSGSRRATVVAIDERLNLALLRVEGTFQTALPFASTAPEVGQQVFAVGRIVDGRTLFVGQGIVSAVVRSPMDALMVSFPLERGMSGAPVVNANGEVIGIATVVASSSTGTLAPFGFAMPSATLQTWLSTAERR